MSLGVLGAADVEGLEKPEETRAAAVAPRVIQRWSPGDFATAQIHGLVRQIFFSSSQKPIRQIVLSPIDYETQVGSLCGRVAGALAKETSGSVAIVGSSSESLRGFEQSPEQWRRSDLKPLQKISTQLGENLWFVPAALTGSAKATTSGLVAYLGELRREFEFSIVEGPPAGQSSETMAMAQFADGIILALSARHTRRATAQRVKESLERSRVSILGTVLVDREFPMPERLYRRL